MPHDAPEVPREVRAARLDEPVREPPRVLFFGERGEREAGEAAGEGGVQCDEVGEAAVDG